ncbi:DUF5133 domain-containing protein [Streptomyces sp. V4-01]|uniref:DUF5133 domain-containing protein n=1 Tax=Actinacidiphila polyblastidii TaxID=3110430 RepID=A0ABU7PE36_9ACTN|nr:DUF5133 domain-containing protein [Streptomyces sp. V4-01]
MLMAHPLILRNLVDEYEAFSALHAENGDPQARTRMEDVAYTLCVSTGTRDVETALTVARTQLSDAGRSAAVPRTVGD